MNQMVSSCFFRLKGAIDQAGFGRAKHPARAAACRGTEWTIRRCWNIFGALDDPRRLHDCAPESKTPWVEAAGAGGSGGPILLGCSLI